ncbi:hypothetical protein ACO0LM_05845 [Undibacterium sp. Di26W]|uniref:hypothetical protein n=1 Tax=Undibacterium sp. Di26W TaxID=3413035 RepID=UPI003BF20CC7
MQIALQKSLTSERTRKRKIHGEYPEKTSMLAIRGWATKRLAEVMSCFVSRSFVISIITENNDTDQCRTHSTISNPWPADLN